jgi:hypothetical protein
MTVPVPALDWIEKEPPERVSCRHLATVKRKILKKPLFL